MKTLKLLIITILISSTAAGAMDVYFSPNGSTSERIIKEINLTNKSISLAIYSFTSADLATALLDAKHRGVTIRVLADRAQLTQKHSEIPWLLSHGVEVKTLGGEQGNRGIMHHKFAIFNGQLLITGSFNWTKNAEAYNYENLLVIDDTGVVSKYALEFERLWNKSNTPQKKAGY